MTLESIRIAADDLSLGLLPDLERSFGVRFPRDLRHVETAGDLFGEMMRARAPSGEGDREGLSMAFYSLRRALQPYWREENARPATPLADQELPWPRALHRILEARTRYKIPKPPMSMFALIPIVLMALAAANAMAQGWWLWAVALLAGCAVAYHFDPREFGGDWKTLGSLARATADANFEVLAAGGADDGEAAAWRVFARALVHHAARRYDPGDVDRRTRLTFG